MSKQSWSAELRTGHQNNQLLLRLYPLSHYLIPPRTLETWVILTVPLSWDVNSFNLGKTIWCFGLLLQKPQVRRVLLLIQHNVQPHQYSILTGSCWKPGTRHQLVPASALSPCHSGSHTQVTGPSNAPQVPQPTSLPGIHYSPFY